MLSDKKSQSIVNTMWIDVGINAGQNYPGDGFLDRRAGALKNSGKILEYEKYEQLSEQLYGLTVYAPSGTDPKTNKPYRLHIDAHDVFVHRVPFGRVDAYIRCSNRPHAAASCRQDIPLEPDEKLSAMALS
jgi:hypothetical protein